MPGGEFLGEFEQIVLLAVLRLGEDAYGVPIRAEIEKCTGRDPSLGAVYVTLSRLEAKGYVESALGEPTAQRGGRAKKYFRATQHGISACRRSQAAIRNLLCGLDLGEAAGA